MIQLIHRYKQSIGIVFLFVAFCFALSGVGIDILHGGGSANRYAAKIDDHTISYGQVQEAEGRLESQYRRMFGENYASLAQSFGLNLTRQAMDNLIDSHLIERESQEIGFAADSEQVKQYIRTELFNPASGRGDFSPEQYRNLLQSMGMTGPQLEAQVKDDLVRTSFTQLLNDIAIVSSKDVQAKLVEQETKHVLSVARYTAGSLLSEVPVPSEEDIKKYYDANATQFEQPAKVAYDYVVLQPADFENAVQVPPQDVEFAYSEAPQRFTTPEQVRVSAIKILYPKEGDPVKMAAVREKAKKAHDEATSGQPFAALVATYSDDLPSKLAGGARGWVTRGKGSEAFEKAVSETGLGAVAPLIEEDWGFEIVKVEEKKPSGQRGLNEVRAELETEIKKRDAPAYAAARARELLEQVKKSGVSLAQLAAAQELTITSTNGLVDEKSDPTPALAGLNSKVLGLPLTDRTAPTLIDIGDSSVLVAAKEFKDPMTAPIEEVKEQVIQSIKLIEARKLASERAQALLEAAKGPEKSLKTAGDTLKASVSEAAEISRATPTTPQLVGVPEELKAEAFKVRQVPAVIDRVFEAPGDVFLVAQVTAIKPPDLNSAEIKTKLEEYRTQASQQATRSTLESTVAQLKLAADIDIDERLLVQN